MSNSKGLGINETRFIDDFYNFSNKKDKIAIAYVPLNLLNSESLRNVLSTKKFLTEENVTNLDYLFGKNPDIEANIANITNRDVSTFEHSLFEVPGTVKMSVSTSGKEEETKQFYWLPIHFKAAHTPGSLYNFIFYHDGEFYGVSRSSFVSVIQSSVFDKVNRQTDQTRLNTLVVALNENGYEITAYELLQSLKFKCAKISLAKVLITLFPNLAIAQITELQDVIKAELIASVSPKEVAMNIFELRGDMITYFYNSKNYTFPDEGTLGNSCMRNDSNTEQIRFYATNPTNVALLSYIENRKLLARAILWTDLDGKKSIDRLYVSSAKFGIKMAAYCKSNGYSTIHTNTSEEYGIPYRNDCVVQLDTLSKMRVTPYLDTMHAFDVYNNLISINASVLETRIRNKNIPNYLITNVSPWGSPYNRDVKFGKNHKEKNLSVQDINRNRIEDLSNYAIVTKPKLGIVHRSYVVTINKTEKAETEWCSKQINKYRSLLPTLVFINKKRELMLVDKQFLVFSNYYRLHIIKKDSMFLPALNSYILKEDVKTQKVYDDIKLTKLRKMFADKNTHLTQEFIDDIKIQFKMLPFSRSLLDFRKSRVYHIQAKNITLQGIKIKGIVVPFKHLRLIKK